MSDRLRLEGIDVYAHHGAHPAERELGQRFVVDVELEADLEPAAGSDDLARGIDYAAVHRVVVATATGGSFHLIETLAGRICRELLARFAAARVRVTVHKTQPPISGFFGRASVTLERDRAWLAGAEDGADLPVTVYLGLGSNLGDRLARLRAAVAALTAHPRVEVIAHSRVWETEPVGTEPQAPYLNACLAVRTELEPLALLDELKRLEAAAGRPREGHNLPRPLDLDILLYGDRVVATGRLRVPHPELARRAFVLEPLCEIAAQVRCPDSGETIAAACAKIRRKPGPWVRPYDGGGLDDVGAGSDLDGPGRPGE